MAKASAVEKARGEVVKVEETVAQWEADRAAKTAELESLEERAGAEVLDDAAAAGRLAVALAELRAGVDIAARAVEAAQWRLEAARRGVLKARAAELRQEAAGLRREADERQRRTAKLCAELAEHEGVEFAPKLMYSPLGTDIAGHAPSTRTEIMRRRAGGLEQEARLLDEQAENASGEQVTAAAGRVLAAAGAS